MHEEYEDTLPGAITSDKTENRCFFNPQQIRQLNNEFSTVENKYEKLIIQYTTLKLNNNDAREYACHGFARRVGTLKRCIQNIYTLCPPDRSDKFSRDECLDLGINLQSFVFNVFGCLDNLAWIWVEEKQVKNEKGKRLPARNVGLMCNKKNAIIREQFSQNFQCYLSSSQINKWYENLEDFRHALAHKIPLYVPPYGISAKNQKESSDLEIKKQEALNNLDLKTYNDLNTKQDKLGFLLPCMSHSHVKNSPNIAFHAQILADWNTIVEISEKFLEELSIITEPAQSGHIENRRRKTS